MRVTSKCLLFALLLAGLAGCHRQTADEILTEANQLFTNKDLYGAEVKFQQLIEKFPGTPQARQARGGLAACYQLTKDFENAGQQYDLLIKELGGPQTPDGYGAFTAKLQMVTEQRDFKKALNLLTETSPSLGSLPIDGHVQIAGNFLSLYVLDKQPEKAKETLDGMMRIAASHPETHEQIILFLNRIGTQEIAREPVLAFYDKFLDQFPDSGMKTRVLFESAKLHQALGHAPEAEKAMDAAEASQKELIAKAVGEEETSTYMLQLGNIYQSRQRNADAKAIYEKVIEQYPKSQRAAAASMFLANIEYSLGNVAAVEQIMRRVVRDFPNTQESMEAMRGLKFLAENANRPTTATMMQAPTSGTAALSDASTSPAAAAAQ